MSLYLNNVFTLSMVDEAELKKGVSISACEISVWGAKHLLSENEFVNCIGHESTAEVINTLLSLNIKAERKTIKMKSRDRAIVMTLKTRPPEGKVLSKEELEQIGYSFALVSVHRMGL